MIINNQRAYKSDVFQPTEHQQETSNAPFFNIHGQQALNPGMWPSGGRLQPAPVLDIGKYSARRREFNFWRELYSFLPDSYLISVLGSGPSSLLKNMVMKLFRDTRDAPQERSLHGLIKLLDKSYELSGREREMASMENYLKLGANRWKLRRRFGCVLT